MFLYRILICEPPLAMLTDLDRLTLDDVADLHEALDLREELQRRAAAAAMKQRG